MKVRVEEISPIERKLSIEVESALVAQELERAYSSLSRQVKVAGFRQGKVPRRILEQRFKDEVESDVVQKVVQKAYFDAIREHSVEAVGAPKVTPEKLTPNAPFSFEARVEVKPKIEPRDYTGLSYKRSPVTVEDKEVEEKLEQMRQSMTRLEDVAGRTKAQAGDFVVVDYQATSEGKDFPGNKGENVTMEVAEGEWIEGNVAALAGLSVGESRSVEYVFPDTYRVEELRKKPASFAFSLKALKEKKVPALDDAFARDTGAGVDTLLALREKVRADLEKAQKQKATTEERESLIAALSEKNPFDLPNSMVERALDVMLENALQSIFRSGVDPRQLGIDFESVRSEMRPRAESEVRGTLLFEAVAVAEKIAVSDDDIEKKLQSLADEMGQPVSTTRQYFKSEEQKQSLSLRLREEKTIEFLKSKARPS
jgi:trigger factor